MPSVLSRGTIPSLKGRFLRGCDLQEQELVKTRVRKRVFKAEGSEV